MKFNKIFTFALAALAMTACSDDKTTNPADVTVEFAESSITVLESSIQLYVPIVVNTDHEGDIKVEVEISEVAPNPAIPNHNFKLTSDRLNIPAGVNEVSLEFLLRDDTQINEDRVFDITITSVDNAGIGTKNVCRVTLQDNDKNPYNGLQGAWKIKYNPTQCDFSSAAFTVDDSKTETLDVVIEGVPEGQLGYGRRLFLCYDASQFAFNASAGWKRQDRIRLDYSEEDASRLRIQIGQSACSFTIEDPLVLTMSDGSSISINAFEDILSFRATLNGQDQPADLTGSMVYKFDEEYTTMTLDRSTGLDDNAPYVVNVACATNVGAVLTWMYNFGNMTIVR